MLAGVERHLVEIRAAENAVTEGRTMSKRKDLRNGRESGTWRPHKWSPAKVRTFIRHFFGHLHLELELYYRPHDVNIALALIAGIRAAAESRDAIHAAGLRTISEQNVEQ